MYSIAYCPVLGKYGKVHLATQTIAKDNFLKKAEGICPNKPDPYGEIWH